jgi:hypothetical protein
LKAWPCPNLHEDLIGQYTLYEAVLPYQNILYVLNAILYLLVRKR